MNVKNEPWKPDDMANRTGGLTVDQTLDKMAENAKELGLDYEPKKAQKPVAWFTEDNKTDKSATTYDKVVAERWKQKGWPATELYTAPPKREWVGLTEEEITSAMMSVKVLGEGYFIRLARAIEAKLKEKKNE